VKPVSDSLQLERLSASEAPELARSLSAMKQQVPDASQLAALAAQLSAQGLPLTSGTPAAPLTARVMARLRKYALITGAALVGLGGVYALLRQPSVDPRLPARNAEAPLGPHDPTQQVPAAPTFGKRAAPAFTNPSPKASPVPIASSSESPDTASESLPEAKKAPAPPAIPGATSPDTARPVQEMPAGGPKTPRATSKSIDSGPESGVAARPSELALLRDARLALRTSPAQALALTEQHRMLYPRGAMVQERELIAVSALASLGRRAAALSRVAEFERDFPTSPYRKQIAQLAR
jgi:hypothetical protein